MPISHTAEPPAPKRLRLLIADDHPTFRDGLRALLTSLPEYDVVGEAVDGQEAIEQARRLQPDLIFMDLIMPKVKGWQAIAQIIQASPHIGIIVVTMFDNDPAVIKAFKAGARGYIVKDTTQEEIVQAIRVVAGGGVMLSAALAERVQAFFASLAPAREYLYFPMLTPRESEVLDLIARGLSNTQIAELLVISPLTVRNHITTLFDKLQTPTRAEAIVRAREAGFGLQPEWGS
jgi:DNA-binding NarL/FixJ family response regulator